VKIFDARKIEIYVICGGVEFSRINPIWMWNKYKSKVVFCNLMFTNESACDMMIPDFK
jgi:hypothetical protein